MKIPQLSFDSPRVTMAIGLVGGMALLATIAPTVPPPDIPPSGVYRPNISGLKLPAKLDFCGEEVPLDNPEVRRRMEREFLLNLQSDGQIMLNLKRSGQYFPIYDSLLKAAGAPPDLKFLSVAESALYQAQSGKGAVGLWQFIPETAQHYGLRVDSFVDERKDIPKSTAAAIRLLVDNKQRFGSWALSAAAYNMGEGATQDDLTFQNGHSFYDLFLNEETSRYVFRIIALKEIMTHPDRYGFFLTRNDYYAPAPATTVMVSDEITNLAQWAESKGTTYKDVKLLNPWILKRNLPKPSGAPYAIAIPAKEGR